MLNKKLYFSALIVFLACSSPAFADGELTDITLDSFDSKSIVHVDFDSDIKYSVFDIKSKRKIILKFGKASFSKDFGSIKDKAVRDFVVGYSGENVRLSLKYSDRFRYNIEKTKSGIDIVFDKKKTTNVIKSFSIRKILVKDFSSYSEIFIYGDSIELAKKYFYMLNNGSSMILDIDNAKNKTGKEKYSSFGLRVKEVSVSTIKDKTRIVFKLANKIDKGYKVSSEKGHIKIIVGSGDSKASYMTAKINQVNQVKFSAKKDIEYIDIETSSNDPHILFKNNGNNIVLTLNDMSIDKNKEGRFDVSEFFGSIKTFDVFNHLKNKTVVVSANLRDKGKVSILQIGNVVRLMIEPEAIAISRGTSSNSTDMFKYSGDKVDLDYDNASIKNVIKTIAEISGVNFVISDNVKGNITIKLNDVPWDQALDLILRSKNLGKEKEGTIIRIAPMKDLKKEYENRAATMRSSMEIEPILTEFVHLKYKKASYIKTMFDNIIVGTKATGLKSGQGATQGGAAPANSASNPKGVLSPRGSMIFDEERNILVIKDTERTILEIRSIISEVDIAPKQVLIEARIVEATDTFSRSFGVSWGGTYNAETAGNVFSLGAGGGIASTAFGTTGVATRGRLVDLPASVGLGSGGSLGLSFGTLAGKVLDLELSAAEADGKIKIVSKPRVLVLDGKEANINEGTDIPFQSVSQNNGTNVQFKKANLGLIVTPFVKGDNEISMHILTTKDSPSTSAVGSNPIISTKQVESDILVKNGETVVIGGIYTVKEENVENKIPFLGDLPILGSLFKNSKKVKNRTELLIFITPRIVGNN